METAIAKNLCPVCGYNLGFEPWKDESPSDEICPSCGIQFGYTDAAGGHPDKRIKIYENLRNDWMEQNMPWWSKGQQPPKGWDPVKQLRRIGVDVNRVGRLSERMNLTGIVRKLDLLDENLFICARPPWKDDSACILVYPTESLGVPQHVKDAGYSYFLSVYDARNLVERGPAGKPLNDNEKVELLLFYAQNDAFPDWIYGESDSEEKDS